MLRWLFRPRCAACGAATDEPLCDACAGTLVELGAACPICAEPGADHTCSRCLHDPLPVERIVAPWRFGGQLASAIRRLKFAGANEVARTIAPLWAPLVGAAVAETDGLVVPVPLHWRRRLRRGFDHTWLLATHACASAGLAAPVPALRRIRHAPPQSTLPASEREENLIGAFVTRIEVTGRVIVLVDDVATTGATLSECARTLLEAGATRVIGVVIARAE